MQADRKALTIVSIFLGIVMFGCWIAHACALYHGNQPSPPPEAHMGKLPAQIGGALT